MGLNELVFMGFRDEIEKVSGRRTGEGALVGAGTGAAAGGAFGYGAMRSMQSRLGKINPSSPAASKLRKGISAFGKHPRLKGALVWGGLGALGLGAAGAVSGALSKKKRA